MQFSNQSINRSTDQSISQSISFRPQGTWFKQDAGVPLESETHGGEDVAVFARGPMSHLFTGLHEQHYIAHAIGYASCVAWNTELCNTGPEQTASAIRPDLSSWSVLVMLAVIILPLGY